MNEITLKLFNKYFPLNTLAEFFDVNLVVVVVVVVVIVTSDLHSAGVLLPFKLFYTVSLKYSPIA